MKVIFCGTPEIAVPSLDALVEVADVVGVVCQPDRPAGRGMKLRPPAVKVRAIKLGLEVLQPAKMKDGSFASWIRSKQVDAALVIAYGRLLTSDTLMAPRLGCVNLHASLLPKYRGAAPIQRAIFNGETETGVCFMQMDEGMDTGDVLACHKLPIDLDETAGSLAVRLGQLAAEVTRIEMPRFLRGELTPTKQVHSAATHAPPITKDDLTLDFRKPAAQLVNQIRGLAPRPGASATVVRSAEKARRLKVLQAKACDLPLKLAPGQLDAEQNRAIVGTGDGLLELLVGQPEGRKAQSGADLLNGRVLQPGDLLK